MLFLFRINSSINVMEYHHTLKPSNALEIVRKYAIETLSVLRQYIVPFRVY